MEAARDREEEAALRQRLAPNAVDPITLDRLDEVQEGRLIEIAPNEIYDIASIYVYVVELRAEKTPNRNVITLDKRRQLIRKSRPFTFSCRVNETPLQLCAFHTVEYLTRQILTEALEDVNVDTLLQLCLEMYSPNYSRRLMFGNNQWWWELLPLFSTSIERVPNRNLLSVWIFNEVAGYPEFELGWLEGAERIYTSIVDNPAFRAPPDVFAARIHAVIHNKNEIPLNTRAAWAERLNGPGMDIVDIPDIDLDSEDDDDVEHRPEPEIYNGDGDDVPELPGAEGGGGNVMCYFKFYSTNLRGQSDMQETADIPLGMVMFKIRVRRYRTRFEELYLAVSQFLDIKDPVPFHLIFKQGAYISPNDIIVDNDNLQNIVLRLIQMTPLLFFSRTQEPQIGIGLNRTTYWLRRPFLTYQRGALGFGPPVTFEHWPELGCFHVARAWELPFKITRLFGPSMLPRTADALMRLTQDNFIVFNFNNRVQVMVVNTDDITLDEHEDVDLRQRVVDFIPVQDMVVCNNYLHTDMTENTLLMEWTTDLQITLVVEAEEEEEEPPQFGLAKKI